MFGKSPFDKLNTLLAPRLFSALNHPRSPTHDSDAIVNAAEEEEEAIFTAVDEEDFSDGFWEILVYFLSFFWYFYFLFYYF